MKKRLIQMMIAVLLITVVPFMSSTQVSAATPNEVASYAKKFLGVPYKFGGTTPSGFDCSGYIRYVFNHFNIDLPRTSAEQYRLGTSVSKSNLQPGDLVFFANTYKPGISHTGIYLGNGQFISAENEGVAISNLNTNPYWGPKYAGAKRLSQVKENVKMSDVYKDVPAAHPALSAIIQLSKTGVINGYSDGTFKPESSITRGQAAAMLNRELKLTANNPVNFTDVNPKNEFAADIAAMNEAGILEGYTTGKFGIYEKLTNAQLAAIVDRAFKLQQIAGERVSTAATYQDVPSTYWAAGSIQALKTLDQTKVFQTSKFNTGADASRADFSAAVFSAIVAK